MGKKVEMLPLFYPGGGEGFLGPTSHWNSGRRQVPLLLSTNMVGRCNYAGKGLREPLLAPHDL